MLLEGPPLQWQKPDSQRFLLQVRGNGKQGDGPHTPRGVACRGPSPPSPVNAELDRFQAVLTEKTYRAAALNTRELNILSLLQVELFEDYTQAYDPTILDRKFQ